MKKLSIIKTNQDWLEATWSEDEQVIHCESFSGHPEHISLLKAKCVEFVVELTEEDEVIIQEVMEAFEMPTQEELGKYELEQKIAEAKWYLSSTDYKMTVDYFATLSEVEQTELTAKRDEAREFIRGNK